MCQARRIKIRLAEIALSDDSIIELGRAHKRNRELKIPGCRWSTAQYRIVDSK